MQRCPVQRLVLGLVLLAVGQLLNMSVFWVLGENGTFYGARWGHKIPWVNGWPFVWWMQDPQYVGVGMSLVGVTLLATAPVASPSVCSALLGLMFGDLVGHFFVIQMERGLNKK